MTKKLNPNHLKKLLNNQCDIKLYQEGLSEEGEPLTSLNLKKQKCRFVEKTKIIISSDGRKVELLGKVILLGDIAPNIKKISGGEVIFNDSKYEIYQGSRPRNPDGSVHHTTLELM
nr:MAG TPA: Minor capsid protein [Caudoviricetes sp.]